MCKMWTETFEYGTEDVEEVIVKTARESSTPREFGAKGRRQIGVKKVF